MSIVADRLREAMNDLGIDQSDVADAIGVTQGAISLILVGKTRQSKFLPDIARFLGVSYDWLAGKSDIKFVGEAPASPRPPLVMLAVQLPNERALTAMFQGILDGVDPTTSPAELAPLLAQSLPTALAQLRDLRPDSASAPRARGRAASRAPVPMPDREAQS